jgi:hypothetical protein
MTKKKIPPLKQIAKFHRHYPSIAAVVWLIAITTGFLFSWPTMTSDLFTIVALSSAVGVLAITLLALYEAELLVRMGAADGGSDWKVQVNDVTVGSISDAAYAKVRHAVFFDIRTHVAQLMNFCSIVNRLIDYLFLSIPLVVFWGGVACYLFFPSTFAEVLDTIRKVTPAEVSAAISHIVKLLSAIAVLVIGVHTMLGHRFGFINRFDEGCNDRLRQLVECPAEGRITLFRFVEGNRFQLNELDTIRKPRAN